MKSFYFLSTLVVLFACSSNQQFIQIPANQKKAINLSTTESANVDLKNKSLKDIQVKVRPSNGGDAIRGFGLGPKGKATVLVESDHFLELENTKDTKSKVSYSYKVASPPKVLKEKNYISFTLANNSAKSIPLIIPSVMNPNLSPYSRSGVDLKLGQKIFFKKGGKRYLLLTVTNSIKEGATINVSKLLKERQKEI